VKRTNHLFRIDWSDVEQVARIAYGLSVLDGQVRVITKHKDRWNYTIREFPKDTDRIFASDVTQIFWII